MAAVTIEDGNCRHKRATVGEAHFDEKAVSDGTTLGDARSCWHNCIYAKLSCPLNFLASPFVLVYHSVRLLLWPCIRTYTSRFLNGLLCCPCRTFCLPCYRFKDRKFPATAASLGGAGGDAGGIVWKRGDDLVRKTCKYDKDGKKIDTTPRHASLFAGKIEPADVQQGGLGNCWLMSALACMSEHPGVIRRTFVTHEHSYRGKYTVKIFDGVKRKWEHVTVDDRIPCKKSSGRPAFAKPNGDELWVMIYEKAFAKFCGSYQNLKGGHELWAFEALTGEEVLSFSRRGAEVENLWTRMDLVHYPKDDNRRAIGLRKRPDDCHADVAMFHVLRQYLRARSVVCASKAGGAGGEAKDEGTGLVAGHAYSVLDVRCVKSKGEEHKLLQLRNPWGGFEWTGAWSDASPLWAKHGKVARLCRQSKDADGDDGCFWMCWEDFQKHFDSVDVCHRSVGVDDIQLDLREDTGCKQAVGPCQGCCWGCTKYWCLCKGARFLYCGHTADVATIKGKKGRDDGLFAQAKAMAPV